MRSIRRVRETRVVPEHELVPTTSHRVTELIEFGRDREAAELGGRQPQRLGDDDTANRGESMDVLSQLDELGPLLAGVVGGISPGQLDNPTPCSEFTVRGVLEHMIGGATVFAATFRGDEPGTPDVGDVLAGFGPALTELASALHGPGALDGTVTAPFGEVPAARFARFVVLDGLVHGWDLATSTGQAYEPADALVAEVESFAAEAAPTPAGATPIERLAAFTGRRL